MVTPIAILLIAFVPWSPAAIPPPAAQTQPNTAIEAAVDRLARTSPGADTDQTVDYLVRQGPAAVAEIGRQLAERHTDFVRVHNSVRVLQAVNDERSRTLLRQLSLGQMTGGNPNLEAWAAQALVACDRAEAWKLLSAPAPTARQTALNAVKGRPIDADQFALLLACLKDSDGLVRLLAASTMAEGADDKLAPEAARAIGAALTAVADLPDAKVTEPVRGRSGFALTPSERYYWDYISALTSIRLDIKSLEDVTRPLTGRARLAVTIVRGIRGDSTARPDLLRLSQDLDAGMFRVWAVNQMRVVGTPEDIPMLRQLADSDPLVRDVHGSGLPDRRSPMHVVRDAAKQAIVAINQRK